MKVLFAINDEKISESIIRKYQATYKEIISTKNVYYFNAIIKELQRDKSYDRIVVSEDLEPYSNKNYDMIDKFLFEKLDNISDEASNKVEGEIPIILICTERREKGDSMLSKLFSIGIYSALLGEDRTVENLCGLINSPRNKKDAKSYYRIESEEAGYKVESAEDVSETEIQNIVNHYKKLGKNEDKYVESFDSIASQYTDTQLKIIVGFLPLGVRAVLEEKCPKYQSLMLSSVKGRIKKSNPIVAKNIKHSGNINKLDIINKALQQPKLTNPVVIPSVVDTNNVKKMYKTKPLTEEVVSVPEQNKSANRIEEKQGNETQQIMTQQQEIKKRRGRPPKVKDISEDADISVKRGRGRPKKVDLQQSNNITDTKETEVNLFDLGNDDTENSDVSILPGLENENFDNNIAKQLDNIKMNNNADWNNSEQSTNNVQQKPIMNNMQNYNSNSIIRDVSMQNNSVVRDIQTQNSNISGNLANLLTSDKKIVAFVGTSKNGTSFLVNNVAALLADKGIKTAILDLTKNKNAYYIYTQNDENLRNQSLNCIEGLRRGEASGVSAGKNLTVYTTLPNEETSFEDYNNILATLAQNYSLVLMDCDFNTNYNYFSQAQEIYLVQTYDILTIQPLTAFLRELEDRNLINPNKLRIVINKSLKVRNLTEKMIIGGISRYNSPDMAYQKDLFDVNTILYTTIPFEDQTYAKYLEGLVTCQISLKGYSKDLLDSISRLGNMVYPLISNRQSSGDLKNYNDYNKNAGQFNRNINSTLNKMRNNY